MAGDRIAQALARIDAAAGRMEAAAARPVPMPAAGADAGDPELARKHAHLRLEACAVLAELDALIGALDR